jgi:putative nucleotidyltransferase with HDIG domain
MDKEKAKRIIENYISRMPSMPTTVAKVLKICNDPQTSPADLNQVISLDPVLMGKVMRLINSAYYSLPNQITSLVRAIIMLGLNTVKNLALSTAVLGGLGRGSDFQALNMEGFWRHSICVGVMAKLIAKHRRVDVKLRDEYFIAGLLHDLGKIPLNNRFADLYVEAIAVTDREQLPLYRAEEKVMGLNHEEAGKLIVESWKLGRDIVDVVSFHHNQESYAGDNRELVSTINVANYFANAYEIGFSGDRYPEQLPAATMEELGIDWDYLEGLEDSVNAEIEKAQIFLQVSD